MAQPDFTSSTAKLKDVLNEPLRVTYKMQVFSASGDKVGVMPTDANMQGLLPDSGKLWKQPADLTKSLGSTGTVFYEVILDKPAVKVTLSYDDGDPLGIYLYDGKDSKIIIYVQNQPDLPAVQELKGRKFRLKYYNPTDYYVLFQDLAENVSALHKVGTAYADKATSPPEYEFIPSEDGSHLKEMNVYGDSVITMKEFSEFVDFNDVLLPTIAREYKTNSSGFTFLDIRTSDVSYSRISPEEVAREFEDMRIKATIPLPARHRQ